MIRRADAATDAAFDKAKKYGPDALSEAEWRLIEARYAEYDAAADRKHGPNSDGLERLHL